MIARILVIFGKKFEMSILIADAGATLTSWAVIDGDKEQVVRTSGINPVLKVDAEIESVLFDELTMLINTSKVKEVHFYGAGCGSWEQAERVQSLLLELFRKKNVHVKTDLEGAGRSIFDRSRGIIAISGTGSSAGFMEKGDLVDQMPSKAYPEGDFGSGSHIGALIMKDYFVGDTPKSIKKIIDGQRRLNLDELFIQFQDPKKSKLIASKALRDLVNSPDFGEPLHQEYLKRIVLESVETLFDQMKDYFKSALAEQSVRFVGSTASTFETYFRSYFKDNGVVIDDFQQRPIHGLIRYHKSLIK